MIENFYYYCVLSYSQGDANAQLLGALREGCMDVWVHWTSGGLAQCCSIRDIYLFTCPMSHGSKREKNND